MTTYLSTCSWRFINLTTTIYLFTCSKLPTYLAITSFIYILHFLSLSICTSKLHSTSSITQLHFQRNTCTFTSFSSMSSLKFIIIFFLCFFKSLCKTLKQPKASSLACPCVSYMSFKEHLQLPSKHPSIVGSIKGKLVVTFLCGVKFQACCHVFCFCFMFFCETRAMECFKLVNILSRFCLVFVVVQCW